MPVRCSPPPGLVEGAATPGFIGCRHYGVCMASPATPLPNPAPPPPDPQAIRACLTPALAAEFDSEWEIVLERAKQSKDLAGVYDLLTKWRHTAYTEMRDPGGVLPDVGQGRADHAHGPKPGRGVVRGHAHVAPATTRPVGVPHRSRRRGVGTGGRAAHRSATRLRGGAGGAPVDAVERAAPAPGPLSSTVRTLRTRTSCRRWSA